jgi:TRAP-type C4-dicarboxylate transport system permease small subunit
LASQPFFARWLKRLSNGVAGALFLALFAVFVIQVAARFLWRQPLPWSDEAAVILYVWIILWSAALVVPQREHVAFDLLWNAAPKRIRQVMQVAGHLLVGGLCLVALPASWDYVHFMRREGSPVLGLPLMWVYLPFVVMLCALVLRSLWAIRNALRGIGLDQDLQP